MTRTFLIVFFISVSFLSSCNFAQETDPSAKIKATNDHLADSASNQMFTSNLETLTKDFSTWYNYTYNTVILSEDFIGLDIDSTTINKKSFLDKLVNGNVVALKIQILNGQSVYQLFHLNSKDESITATIKQMASTELAHYKMEGSQIPDFRFTDLKGKVYDKSSIKGKIVVLKCWFIHCVACVKEFPELNELVLNNQNRKDVLFISLAIDSKKDLQSFLSKKEFMYAVIPDAERYMTNNLHIAEYPTHILINRNGKILKVVNRITELTPFLKNQLG